MPVTVLRSRGDETFNWSLRTVGFRRSFYRKDSYMRTPAIPLLKLALVAGILTVGPGLAGAADDGAALYKTKCAACHAPDGTGKAAIKAPSLVSPEAKKLTDAELTDAIANGGKNKKATHQYAQKGLTAEQIKALVAEIRSMQK
jgi:mono/diheme cytochrome c family protein